MAEIAAELGLGFRLGLVSRDEIIQWADQNILKLDKPSEQLVDLSLMGKAHTQDILGKLSALSAGVSTLDVLPSALARYSERLASKPELGKGVAEALYSIYIEHDYDVPNELSAMAGFDDDYHLAESGVYDSVDSVTQRIVEFMRGFKDAL